MCRCHPHQADVERSALRRHDKKYAGVSLWSAKLPGYTPATGPSQIKPAMFKGKGMEEFRDDIFAAVQVQAQRGYQEDDLLTMEDVAESFDEVRKTDQVVSFWKRKGGMLTATENDGTWRWALINFGIPMIILGVGGVVFLMTLLFLQSGR